MKPEFEARPEVEALPAGYVGEVATGCQAIRIRNTSTKALLTLDVSGNPFTVPPGGSWGFESGDIRAVILRPVKVNTGTATALVERIYLTSL